MKKTSGFVIYYEDLTALASMTDAQIGRLIRALANMTDDVPPEISFAYALLKKKKERDEERYDEICEINRQNARIRWDYATASDRIPENATASDRIRPHTIVSDRMRMDAIDAKGNSNSKSKGKGTTEIIIKEIGTRAREELFDIAGKKRILTGSRVEDRIFAGIVDEFGEDAVRTALESVTSLVELKRVLQEAADDERTERSSGAVADL